MEIFLKFWNFGIDETKRCHEQFFNHNFVDENKVTQPIFCDEISFDRGKLNVSVYPKIETGFDMLSRLDSR